MDFIGQSRFSAKWGTIAIAALIHFPSVSNAVFIQPGGEGPGSGLDAVFDNITVSSPNPGNTSSIDIQSDQLSDDIDSLWKINRDAEEAAATVVIELAGFANTNTFGIYDASNSSSRVQMFAGSAGEASQAILRIEADGSVWVNWVDTGIDFAGNRFGYYLDSSARNSGGLFFSDTALNADAQDHMVAYQGKGTDTIKIGWRPEQLWDVDTYALAWEDFNGGGDGDYQDFVVMVNSVMPVPVPAAVWLFASGLLGMIAISRRRKST